MVEERSDRTPDMTGEEPVSKLMAEDGDIKDGGRELTDGEKTEPETEKGEIDYAALEREDLRELCEHFPALIGKRSITELKNPLRYAALRDLGLTPREAYLATEGVGHKEDNRGHIVSRVPHSAGSGTSLSGRELSEARELFSGLSDREIQRLYKKVTV